MNIKDLHPPPEIIPDLELGFTLRKATPPLDPSLVILKLPVTDEMISELRNNVKSVRDLTDGTLPWPSDFKVHLLARSIPIDFVFGRPSYSTETCTSYVCHEYVDLYGNIYDWRTTRKVRIHEIIHAPVDLVASQTSVGKAVVALIAKRKAISTEMGQADAALKTHLERVDADPVETARLKKIKDDRTLDWFRARRAIDESDAWFLQGAVTEFLVEVASALVLGDPTELSNTIGKADLKWVQIEDLPDQPAPGIFKVEYGMGPYGPSQTVSPQPWESELGWNAHTHYDAVKLFLYERVFTSLRYREKPRLVLQKIIKVLLEEIEMRFANQELSYFQLSPREANRRLVKALEEEFELN